MAPSRSRSVPIAHHFFIAPHRPQRQYSGRMNVHGDVIALARLLYGHIEVSK